MKILIVEDEEKIAKSLQRGLQQEGYSVEIAFDGQSGLNIARAEDFDLLVLDIMMPILDGFEVLDALRNEGIKTPVLVLTARGAIEDKVKGLNNGADDYLAKPFSFDELLARVRALIRRSKNSDPILKIDTLELNPSMHSVIRCGTKIELTAREYALLEYLMNHLDGIVSETQLLDHVWDGDYDGFSNVVAVHIKNLRLKIDRAFPNEKQLIKTVRGIGYKLTAD